MIAALATGMIVFCVSFFGLNLIEVQIHRMTKNSDKSYRLGVWIFAILGALYGFATTLGR